MSPSAETQRWVLDASHFTAVGPMVFACMVGKDSFTALYILNTVFWSCVMHACDNSRTYDLVGDTWCMDMTARMLYTMDRVFACEAFQVVFLYGPDWRGTDARLNFLLVGLVGNLAIVLRYRSETWPVVGFGVALFVITQGYRWIVLYTSGRHRYFLRFHVNIPAYAIGAVFCIGAVVSFWMDENDKYWYLHSIWHCLIYLAAMFGLWGCIGVLRIGYPCVKDKVGAERYPRHFWSARGAYAQVVAGSG